MLANKCEGCDKIKNGTIFGIHNNNLFWQGQNIRVLKINRRKFLRLKDIHISQTYLPIICPQNVSFSRRHQAAVIIVTSHRTQMILTKRKHPWEGRHHRLIRSLWGSVTSPFASWQTALALCPRLWTEGQV